MRVRYLKQKKFFLISLIYFRFFASSSCDVPNNKRYFVDTITKKYFVTLGLFLNTLPFLSSRWGIRLVPTACLGRHELLRFGLMVERGLCEAATNTR